MPALALSWSILALFLYQGVQAFGTRVVEFRELPFDERCEWVLKVWQQTPTRGISAHLYRGGIALACLALLGRLLARLQDHSLPYLLSGGAPDTSLKLGATLIAIYVAGVAYLKILQSQRANHGLTLARDFLAETLSGWRDRLAPAFQARDRGPVGEPADGLRALLTHTEAGPEGVPYRSLTFLEVTVGDALYLAESPTLDAVRESRFLAVDMGYCPRLDFAGTRRTRLEFSDLAGVDHRPVRVPHGPDRAALILTMLDGRVHRWTVDPEGVALVADCVRERLRRRRSTEVTRPAPAEEPGDAARVECPECAEWIRPRARKCRYCGHRLGEDSAAAQGPEAPRLRSLRGPSGGR